MISCSDCICRYCLYWWSGRCPYGECRDDWRAKCDPYKGSRRTGWSDWDKPGEQEHWCRGGSFYPAEECEKFEEYTGQIVEQCHKAPTLVFQDGYRECSMKVNGTCERCLKELAEIAEGRKNEQTN